ncbi:hypothetical protein GE09DRAFT_1258623 [Coniochaeta sp. 2T2.1]|nr:hypothetical protein GE09DRAFT_1258623 [Coniochaeta sp. 2T2.1]
MPHFTDWPSINGGKPVEIMAGQHRPYEFYDRNTLPPDLNLKLRANRLDPTMADSHSQIWTQLTTALSQNPDLLQGKNQFDNIELGIENDVAFKDDLDLEKETDDDGLGSYSTFEGANESYLETDRTDKQSAPTSQARDLKIDYYSGDYEMKPESLASRLEAPGFDAAQALELFQRRLTMDYGKRGPGSRPASRDHAYYPAFHLDMISIVGRPLLPITSRNGFFDNVTFSLRYWQAPYSSKYVVTSLPFSLQNRTFRIAIGASREIWFVVMHPVQPQTDEASDARGRRRAGKASSGRGSAVKRHHAEALAAHIKDVFLDGELLGEGVEPSWALGGHRSQSISYDKWSVFQNNLPAFYSYDYGTNIEIEVGGPLHELPQETRLRRGEKDGGGSSSSESGDDGDESWNGIQDSDGASDSPASPYAAESGGAADGDKVLYTDGLEHLRSELERKYRIDNIEQVSYTLAADIYYTRSGGELTSSTVYLLSDRSDVAKEYRNEREFSFYPLVFHPRYGNYSSSKPPAFLHNLCTILRDNRTIRSRPDDLLATKGIATAALTLPPSEARQNARVRARQQRLVQALRGELTPDEPESSMPFARERHRVEAAIEQDQLSFRMEQVVTVRTSRLESGRRDFFSVLRPIFQLMRFFLKETRLYIPTLRTFKPSVFPKVLCSYATLFELALGEMDRRYRATSDQGLGPALSEAVAVLDRLGHFCFTGDPRVLPTTVLTLLLTMESLRKGAWPFIWPDMLDFREGSGVMNISRWPQTQDRRPALLHISALAFHYGPAVAAGRHSQIWFGHMRSQSIRQLRSAVAFLEEVFRGLWIPEMVTFMACQLRRHCGSGTRGGRRPSEEHRQQLEQFHAALEAWGACKEPFSNWEYAQLFTTDVTSLLEPESTVARTVSTATRYDFATQLSVLGGAIQYTDDSAVSSRDWIDSIVSVTASVGIEWVPGSHRKKITSQHVVQLVGRMPGKQILAARPGSLKRAAMEAELEMAAEERGPKRPQRRTVDLGQDIPFGRVPKIILAYNCLVDRLGDLLCDLMLMLTLTIAASSVTPYVAPSEKVFGAAPKRKDPAMLAANIVTRMLWFLCPEVFPWEHDERGVLRVGEMTKKIEHKGINNRTLRQLGWIVSKTTRDSPRNVEYKLRAEDELFQVYKDLLYLRRKDADGFILRIFGSVDPVWVDRCASIIQTE